MLEVFQGLRQLSLLRWVVPSQRFVHLLALQRIVAHSWALIGWLVILLQVGHSHSILLLSFLFLLLSSFFLFILLLVFVQLMHGLLHCLTFLLLGVEEVFVILNRLRLVRALS